MRGIRWGDFKCLNDPTLGIALSCITTNCYTQTCTNVLIANSYVSLSLSLRRATKIPVRPLRNFPFFLLPRLIWLEAENIQIIRNSLSLNSIVSICKFGSDFGTAVFWERVTIWKKPPIQRNLLLPKHRPLTWHRNSSTRHSGDRFEMRRTEICHWLLDWWKSQPNSFPWTILKFFFFKNLHCANADDSKAMVREFHH